MTILIVDDNKQNIYLLQVVLQGNGYQVVAAANGAEALEKARQYPPGLIISDILMPVMDGFTLCREWMKDERLRSVPFVFYTATYTEERDREFALSLGAERFIVKPEEPEIFLLAVREVIEQVQRPPAASKPVPTAPEQENETGYLQQYNAALIRKLEDKMQELEQTNRDLEHGIIERKKMENLLAFRAMLLEISTEASIDGILAVDTLGHVILANKRFNELWKIPKSLLDEHDDVKMLDYVLEQVKDPDEFRRKIDYLYKHKSEISRDEINFVDERCFDRYSSPLIGADGKYYGRIWFFRDITVRKKAEEEIIKLNKELDERVKQRTAELVTANKYLDAFNHSIAHDLKAPLRAISGFTQILAEDYLDKIDAEGRRLVNVIRDNVTKMGLLIDDLLALAHVNKLEMQAIDINMTELAQSVCNEVKAQPAYIQRAIEVSVQPLPPARGDLILVRQILANVISNAMKFTARKEKAVIEIGGYGKGEVNVYYVKDNGAGFDMKFADKLFNIFQRFHSQDEFYGTGIGLAIVESAVKRHGGAIWAEAEVDKGATFCFTLPKG